MSVYQSCNAIYTYMGLAAELYCMPMNCRVHADYFSVTVCAIVGQEDLKAAAEGADSVLVSLTCGGHVTVT